MLDIRARHISFVPNSLTLNVAIANSIQTNEMQIEYILLHGVKQISAYMRWFAHDNKIIYRKIMEKFFFFNKTESLNGFWV